jgi:hypothetical protein
MTHQDAEPLRLFGRRDSAEDEETDAGQDLGAFGPGMSRVRKTSHLVDERLELGADFEEGRHQCPRLPA